QLKRARHAEGGELVGRSRRHAAAPHDDVARLGGEMACQQVDERRLSRAVRADQPDEIALGDREIDGVRRGDAAEALDERSAPDDGTVGASRRRVVHPLAPSWPASWGTSCSTRRAVRTWPSRTNCTHSGVSRPLRAKRMVSSRRTPKITKRQMPNARRYSSRNSTQKAPPTAVGIRSMPPSTVMTTTKAIRSRSPMSGVSTTL